MSVKISALPAAAALTGAEQIEAVQGGVSVRSTTGAVAALAAGAPMQGFSGDYSGGVPTDVPTGAVAVAFDTVTGTQWNWYAGAWH